MADLRERLLDETREEIYRADNKASIVLAGAGVAIGALVAGLIAGEVGLAGEPWLVWVLTVLSALSLIAGVASVGTAVYPHLGVPEQGRARYFGEIANFSGDLKGFREVLQKEAANQADRHTQQVLILSILVKSKYESTRRGMLLLAIGFALAGAAGLLAKV